MKASQKRLTKTKEKKLDKFHFRILIGLMIFGTVYYLFLDPTTIGHDIRYTIYIVLLPTLLGLLILTVYRRKFLINKFSTNKGFRIWMFMTFFYGLQGLLFSYLSFGQIAKISWDILNERTAKQQAEEIIDCKITKFRTMKHIDKIDFLFKDRHNKLDVSHKTLKDYLDKSSNDYYLEIKARKGFWNYYLVKSWDIKSKKSNTTDNYR